MKSLAGGTKLIPETETKLTKQIKKEMKKSLVGGVLFRRNFNQTHYFHGLQAKMLGQVVRIKNE